jgi:hypothetical protein
MRPWSVIVTAFGTMQRSYLPAVGYLVFYVLLLVWEVCVPPFLGLANNADFPESRAASRSVRKGQIPIPTSKISHFLHPTT